jgi:urease accessory protein
MLELVYRLPDSLVAQHRATYGDETGVLSLPFERRQKSRFRHHLDDGREVGVIIPRGQVLRDGDGLISSDRTCWVRIQAATEQVSTARATNAHLLARGCYHLGNRHVMLEIGVGYIRYLHDHVLDAMLDGLGLTVIVESARFEPESGAYGQHSGAHGGAGSHTHG